MLQLFNVTRVICNMSPPDSYSTIVSFPNLEWLPTDISKVVLKTVKREHFRMSIYHLLAFKGGYGLAASVLRASIYYSREKRNARNRQETKVAM